jgi:ATP adenylyltransferase
MNFFELKDFITKKMRLSHIYQPVMLLTLLQMKGECSEVDIARAILAHDQSQIEYYEKITRDMVGRVLRRHKAVERKGKAYRLVGFESFTGDEVLELDNLCREKLAEYLERRGVAIWQHRRKSTGYISGTDKYEVLKRAKFHCELCGVAADLKALEVDHIIPRNQGGSDDMSNYQALCYSCNAMKKDRDDTDFHLIRESYKHRQNRCIFCQLPEYRKLRENELAYAMYDGFPVTELHSLIVPKRHVDSYFELGQAEINACNQLLAEMKAHIESIDKTVTGSNIGVNNAEDAGQTIFHCHIHLIPRRKGDVEDPRGGVRHIIPGKGFY